MLKQGSRGEEVEALQKKLAKIGFDPGPIDGVFGPKTEAAVRAFQAKHDLQVDGIFGPDTTAKLEKRLKKFKEGKAERKAKKGDKKSMGTPPPMAAAARPGMESGMAPPMPPAPPVAPMPPTPPERPGPPPGGARGTDRG